MSSVVGHVALEKYYVMAATAQRRDQSPPQSRVAVAPGGAQREAKDDYLHVGSRQQGPLL